MSADPRVVFTAADSKRYRIDGVVAGTAGVDVLIRDDGAILLKPVDPERGRGIALSETAAKFVALIILSHHMEFALATERAEEGSDEEPPAADARAEEADHG